MPCLVSDIAHRNTRTDVYIINVQWSCICVSVLWCSGYHVCFTRRRSRVRTSSEPFLGMLRLWYALLYLLFHSIYMITIFLSRLFLPPTKCREYRTTKLTKEVLREKSVWGGGTTSECKNAREKRKGKRKGIKTRKKFVRSGIRTHAHIRGPERPIPICLLSEGNQPWVWRLRPLGHPDDTMCSILTLK